MNKAQKKKKAAAAPVVEALPVPHLQRDEIDPSSTSTSSASGGTASIAMAQENAAAASTSPRTSADTTSLPASKPVDASSQIAAESAPQQDILTSHDHDVHPISPGSPAPIHVQESSAVASPTSAIETIMNQPQSSSVPLPVVHDAPQGSSDPSAPSLDDDGANVAPKPASNPKSRRIAIDQAEKADFIFKLLLLGDSGVGKTSLVSRFTRDAFELNSKPTIGVEFATISLRVGPHIVKAQLWDTAGQERYKSITTSYYRGAVAALICFDIGRRDTFTNVSMWWNELKQHTNASLLVLLVGNKSDRFERKVSTEEATDFARRHNFAYIETSALANKNVERAFESVIGDVHRVISRVKFGAGAASGGGARNQHTRATSGEAHELLMTGMAAPDDASMRAVAIGSGKSIEIPIDLSAAPEVSATRLAILQSNCCGMS